MSQTVILGTPLHRTNARLLIDRAPPGSVVTIKPPTRTLDQNALMWSLLSEISRAKPEGRSLTPEVWKALMMHSLSHEVRFEQALDGKGVVPVGFKSSTLTKPQMSELIEFILEYAARHNIELKDAA